MTLNNCDQIGGEEGLEKTNVKDNELDHVAISNGENNEDSDLNGLPLELQCEDFNADDPNMDPLEWSVRKGISIPKAYYWDTGNYELPMRIKIWHHTILTLGRALRFAEKAGEIVANVTGINHSRYDYVTSTMTDEQWKAADANAEDQKKRRKAYLDEKKLKSNAVV